MVVRMSALPTTPATASLWTGSTDHIKPVTMAMGPETPGNSEASLVTSHVIVLPLAEEANDEVSSELTGKDLGEEVNV